MPDAIKLTAKKGETRKNRLKKLIEQSRAGKRI
jgi:hypothetical protein